LYKGSCLPQTEGQKLRRLGLELHVLLLFGQYTTALFFFGLFTDNLLRLIEGRGWKGFWPCSGKYGVVVLHTTLSLLAQLAFWSRIVSSLNQHHT